MRAAAPMVPMRLFRAPAFSAGVAASFLFYAAMYGVLFLLPQFLQTMLGFGPLGAGLRLLPWTATLFVTAPVAGAIVNRFGERPLVATGLIDAGHRPWLDRDDRRPRHRLSGIGGAVGAGRHRRIDGDAGGAERDPGSVAPTEIGKASGIFNMARFLGGMFGIAAMVAVFSAQGAGHSATGFSAGFAPAMMVAAALSLLGACAGLALPARRRPASTPAAAARLRSIGVRYRPIGKPGLDQRVPSDYILVKRSETPGTKG